MPAYPTKETKMSRIKTTGSMAKDVLQDIHEQMRDMNDAQLDALHIAITAERRIRAIAAFDIDDDLPDAVIERMTPSQMDAYIAGEMVA